jgi:putative peptidoglycan lipid II flippase
MLRVFHNRAGISLAIPLPGWLGIEPRWGAAGLTASAGLAAWVEFPSSHLPQPPDRQHRIGRFLSRASLDFRLVAALVGWGILRLLGATHPVARAAVVLVPFGLLYVAILAGWGVPEAGAFLARVRGEFGRIR